MDIDDSYFESEDQACSDSESDKRKERESYCARRCELGWFLEESSPATSSNESAPVSSQSSGVDSCERFKEQAEGCDFMLLKYQADLYYSLKEFSSAAVLFEQVLKLLPPLNAMVKREVTDSLARCYGHLGQHQLAEEKAIQMVLPPYDSDASSWKLLSQCQENSGNYEDHVISLQKCVAIERQHADFWMTLADAYRLLKVTYNGDESGTGREQLNVPDQLRDILSNTLSLFRPYFSWRGIISRPNAIKKMNQLLISEDELHVTSDANGQKVKPNLPTPHENIAKMNSDHCDLERWCHKDCPFFTHSQSSAESNCCLYQTILGGSATPRLSLCLLHSPFVILASRQATVEEFMQLLKSVEKSRSVELLCSFYSMAECSCYLWARQLLLYSLRYSSSFAKVATTARLEQLEKKLSTSDQDIVKTFLLHHFTQRTVFENVSNHSS